MNVLCLPYMAFKNMHEASGVVPQAEMYKALASVGVNVTVLWPDNVDGWKYDTSLLEGFPNLHVHRVPFARDQDLSAGLIPAQMLRCLTPEHTPLVYDCVLSGAPAAVTSLKRWLTRTGFSRLNPGLVSYFDVLTVPEEFSVRGGVPQGWVNEMSLLECIGALRGSTILWRDGEYNAFKGNLRKLLTPSQTMEAVSRTHVMARPFSPPHGIKLRQWSGGQFEMFSARSFEPGFEGGGEHTVAVVEALKVLRAMGKDVKLRLYTRSPQSDWANKVISESGGALEVRYNRPRDEVMKGLYECPASIDLRDYDAQYIASVEQVLSGCPHVYKKTVWSDGEINSPWWVAAWDKAQIVGVIQTLMDNFEGAAENACLTAQDEVDWRSYHRVGHALKDALKLETNRLNPKFSADSFKSMAPLFEDLPAGEQDWLDVLALVESRMDSGKLGRYSLGWAARMIEAQGRKVEFRGGVTDPSIVVV